MLLLVSVFFSIGVYAEESDATSSEYYQNYETVMALIELGAITDKTEEQLLKSAIIKLAEEDSALYYKFMDNVAKSIDENCAFYTPEEYNTLYNDLVGETGGIGVMGTIVDGYFEITNVFEDGTAYEVGIETGDRIIACDGRDLTGKNAETATNYIRGPVGSSAVITVLKKNGKTVDVNITRKVITITYHSSAILEDNIGYLQLQSFSDTITEECFAELDKFKEQNVKNVILDLRYNGGGYMNGAINIASKLLDKGQKIISVRDKHGNSHEYIAEGGGEYNFNFIILVNQYTASAAEILTVALTENSKAVSVGTKTYGKATVQSIYPIGSVGGYLRITVQQYLSPLGNFIHREGITPVHYVENSIKTYDISELDLPSFETKPRLGDKSEDVKKIEVMLDILGYDVGTPDEYYGEDTERAVRMLQSRRGLFVYGVCDITTQASLRDFILESKFEENTQLDYAVELIRGK